MFGKATRKDFTALQTALFGAKGLAAYAAGAAFGAALTLATIAIIGGGQVSAKSRATRPPNSSLSRTNPSEGAIMSEAKKSEFNSTSFAFPRGMAFGVFASTLYFMLG